MLTVIRGVLKQWAVHERGAQVREGEMSQFACTALSFHENGEGGWNLGQQKRDIMKTECIGARRAGEENCKQLSMPSLERPLSVGELFRFVSCVF